MLNTCCEPETRCPFTITHILQYYESLRLELLAGCYREALYALYFLSKSFCQCLLRSGNTLGKRICLKSSMHFLSSSSSTFFSSSSSSTPAAGPPFSLTVGLGSVFMLRVVGRWGLSAGRGVGGGGLEVEEDFDDRSGGGRTRGDSGGRSEVSAAIGGGGGGRGGVRRGWESRGSGCRMSSIEPLLVSGRLCVRPVLLGSTVAASVTPASGLEVTTSVIAGGSELMALEMTDEPPAAQRKNGAKFRFRFNSLFIIVLRVKTTNRCFQTRARQRRPGVLSPWGGWIACRDTVQRNCCLQILSSFREWRNTVCSLFEEQVGIIFNLTELLCN